MANSTEFDSLPTLTDELVIEKIHNQLKNRPLLNLDNCFNNPQIDQCFKEIYKRYQTKIERYCSRFLTDKDILQDIYHDVFIKVCLNIHRFKTAHSFRAWIYTIARNSCINYLRSHNNRELAILNSKISDSDEMIDLLESKIILTEKEYINSEIKKVMRLAIDKLPPVNRSIYILKVNEKFTFEEISEIEKVSVRSAKGLYSNALVSIRNHLLENGIRLIDLTE